MEKGAGKNPNYYPDKLQEVADQKAAKDRVREAEEESAQEKRDAKAKALLDSKKKAKKDKDARSQAKEKALVRCAWLYECHRWLMGRPPPPLVHAWPDCAFPPLLRASATRGSYLQAAAGPSPPSRTSARRTTNT